MSIRQTFERHSITNKADQFRRSNVKEKNSGSYYMMNIICPNKKRIIYRNSIRYVCFQNLCMDKMDPNKIIINATVFKLSVFNT